MAFSHNLSIIPSPPLAYQPSINSPIAKLPEVGAKTAKELKELQLGVKQGMVLGPLLYILYKAALFPHLLECANYTVSILNYSHK